MLKEMLEDFFVSRLWKGGYGLWKNYSEASAYSKIVNDRQRRRYWKYGRVPAPFIEFLKSIGVDFGAGRAEGISVSELEHVLMSSESANPLCKIANPDLRSLLMEISRRAILRQNPELARTHKLVSTYSNLYARSKKGDDLHLLPQ